MYKVVSDLSIECSLIRTVIEDLQELAPTQMEHQLRVDAEVVAQAEAGGVLLPIIRERLARSVEYNRVRSSCGATSVSPASRRSPP